MSDLDLLHRFCDLHLWVAGDLILDEYVAGAVRRVSPEAPVPVVNVARAYRRLGGAANVAHAMTALGARVSLCGVVGDDEAGVQLVQACIDAGIDTRAVGRIAGRPTTRKLRVLAQRQQLLRLDWETTAPVDDALACGLVERLESGFESGPAPDALVLSDYAKGFLSPAALARLVAAGRARGIPVLVDPKRIDLAPYRGATVCTPNLQELETLLGRSLGVGAAGDLGRVVDGARELLARRDFDALVVTLGERGVVVVDGAKHEVIAAESREVFDVTGAGDMVIATLALGLAAGVDLATAARIANVAAGLVVGKVGTATVSSRELAAALVRGIADKVLDGAAALQQVAWWRLQGRRVVFTNGCFDLLHTGHLSLLRQAAACGDVLVVGINSDASVARIKGEGRPLIDQRDRAALVAALDCVAAVVVFDEDTPLDLIRALRPDVLVKGADHRLDQVVGREQVESWGGRVVLVPQATDRSTTRMVERIKGG